MRHRAGSAVIGLIAAAALVVTFTNSFGAIAGRADSTEAERSRAKAEQADVRAELASTHQRDALNFTPTTDEAVKTARDAVTTAEQIRIAECDKRGPKCRERENEELVKRDALAVVHTNKALTDQAAKLDAETIRVRAKLARGPKVQNANPLGAALEQIIGIGPSIMALMVAGLNGRGTSLPRYWRTILCPAAARSAEIFRSERR
jgi:hypothetical protein